MPKLGIVTGLAFEARIARSTRRPDTEVLCRGPGPKNARIAAETLVDGGAQALMSFGVAGALDPALDAGRVVVADTVISGPSQAVECTTLETEGYTVGSLLGVNDPIATIADKAAAFAETGALAVDMESHAVAAVASDAGVPLYAVRAIIDPANQQLPPSVLAGSKPGGGLNLGGLFLGLLKNPRELKDVVRLARQNRAAQAALRDFAALRLPDLFLGEEV